MKTQTATALALVLTVFIPAVTHASYFTLPVGVNPGTDISAWFDHDSGASSFLRYDGDTVDNYDGHIGTDFATSTGVEVLAPADGEVKDVYWDNCGGWQIHVWHSAIGLSTLYSHLGTTTSATTTSQVSRGEHIADVDVTGSCTTGPHLHFGVTDGENRATSNRIDPFGWSGGGSDPWTYDLGYLWTANPPAFPYYWHADFESYSTGLVPNPPWVATGVFPRFTIVNSNTHSGSKAGSNVGFFGRGVIDTGIDFSTLTGGFVASVAYKSVDSNISGQAILLGLANTLSDDIVIGPHTCILSRFGSDDAAWITSSASFSVPLKVLSNASTSDGNYHVFDVEVDVMNSRCRGRADTGSWTSWSYIATTGVNTLASTSRYLYTGYPDSDDIAYFDDFYIYPKW